MAGEVIHAWVYLREPATDPSVYTIRVGWMISAAIVGPDGKSYQNGIDPVKVNTSDDMQTVATKCRAGVASRISDVTGQAFVASDVEGFQAVRTGTITVSILELTKAVVFSANMPSTNYRVHFQPQSALATNLGYSSKTVSGFTLTLSVGVVGTIDYLAVED